MEWFSSPDYWLSRWLFERLLAAIYVIAYLNAWNEFPALLGQNGLLPAPRYLAVARFRGAPSLFHVHYSDTLLRAVSGAGIVLSVLLVAGVPQAGPAWVAMLTWLVLWVMYVSIVNVGQTFYSFGWESLLLEAGFVAVFLGPARTAPPTTIMWFLRWLLFRLEFGAGLIKLRHDPCWRDLTCLYYHHETQPMPNPLSWYFHWLPKPLHKVEVLGNHFGQLIVPFGLFLPQPIAGAAAALMIVHQVWLILSGNFAWLNWLTLAVAVPALDDTALGHILPVPVPALEAPDGWYTWTVIGASALFVALSYAPARNLISRGQLMNFTYNPVHLVNSYGAFGNITRERNELVLEGTREGVLTPDTAWSEYEFKGKPGNPRRRPPQMAPYHLRLDWLMWFAAMSPAYAEAWLLPLVTKLLLNDAATLRLLAANPFADSAPAFVRASLYRYRFTTRAERRASGDWWVRRRLGTYLQPVRGTPQRSTRVAPASDDV
jgi:Lipase maturation factor